MCDVDVLVKLAQFTGCGNVRRCEPPTKPHHRQAYIWRISRREDVKRLLTAWFPYFGERRQQKVLEAFAFYEFAN